MGMLNESSMYPIFDMKTLGATLVGEVWGEPKEMRGVPTRFDKPGEKGQDFYYIPILPKGAAPGEDQVVTLSITPGARLAGLAAAVRAAGGTDVEVGAKIAVQFSSTRPSNKGNDMHIWTWQYQRPEKVSTGGGMLGEAAADAGNYDGNPAPAALNLLD